MGYPVADLHVGKQMLSVEISHGEVKMEIFYKQAKALRCEGSIRLPLDRVEELVEIVRRAKRQATK